MSPPVATTRPHSSNHTLCLIATPHNRPDIPVNPLNAPGLWDYLSNLTNNTMTNYKRIIRAKWRTFILTVYYLLFEQ